jgi:glycosyltransferase involved in cell wall biosynthesis
MSAAISVVIPTYNATAFIRETLASVFNQTLPPQEIIVVDDASTDGTADLVAELARAAPVPLRLLQCLRNCGGPSRPLNWGISQAKGTVIATLDHDDTWLPDKLERQLDCLRREPTLGLVFVRCKSIDLCDAQLGKDRKLWEMREDLPRQVLGNDCYRIRSRDAYASLVTGGFLGGTCSSFLFPKRMWRRCGGIDESAPTLSDFSLLMRIARRFDLGFVDRVLVYWNYIGSNLYSVSNGLDTTRDALRIHLQIETDLLDGQTCSVLRRTLRKDYMDLAYGLRQHGNYWQSGCFYLGSLRYGYSIEALTGVVKLVPHRLLRRWLSIPAAS